MLAQRTNHAPKIRIVSGRRVTIRSATLAFLRCRPPCVRRPLLFDTHSVASRMATVETIDNTETAGEAVTTQPFAIDADIDTVVSWVSIVENDFDVGVDVTVQLTTDDDEAFDKFITDSAIAEGVTVASGSRDGFGDGDNEPFSYVRLQITPVSDPTSGTVDVTFQRRRTVSD